MWIWIESVSLCQTGESKTGKMDMLCYWKNAVSRICSESRSMSFKTRSIIGSHSQTLRYVNRSSWQTESCEVCWYKL